MNEVGWRTIGSYDILEVLTDVSRSGFELNVVCPFPEIDDNVVLYSIAPSDSLRYNWDMPCDFLFDDGSMARLERIRIQEADLRLVLLSDDPYGFMVGDILPLEGAILFKFCSLGSRKFVRWRHLTRLKGLV
jgi:hypothetical protein